MVSFEFSTNIKHLPVNLHIIIALICYNLKSLNFLRQFMSRFRLKIGRDLRKHIVQKVAYRIFKI